MTYSAIEQSVELGAPVELYEFAQGLTRWLFASSAEDIEFNGQLFIASPIKRDRIKSTPDVFKDGVSLTLPRGNEFANQFIGFAPDEVTTVTIHRGHYGDNDYIIYWKGRVAGISVSENEITLECESVFTSVRRPGLRARYEYTCRHALYSQACGAAQDAVKHVGTVLSIDGSIRVTVSGAASYPNGHFTGGLFVAPDGVSRFITAHTSDVVTLNRPIQSLAGAQSVTIYPGCDHLLATCKNKFNNIDNFGGFPFIPQRNPFDGSSII